MGWTVHFQRPANIKTECDSLFKPLTVVKSAMVGSVYYASLKHAETETVFAVVVLTKKYRDGAWGYKDMDETMGPLESKCPRSILDTLTPTESACAQAWRDRCRAYAGRQRPQYRVGTVVDYGGRSYRLTGRHAWRRASWVAVCLSDGLDYRFSSVRLSQSRIVSF